jgi:hypothetical protein
LEEKENNEMKEEEKEKEMEEEGRT